MTHLFPPDSPVLCNWVFDNFISANYLKELYEALKLVCYLVTAYAENHSHI